MKSAIAWIAFVALAAGVGAYGVQSLRQERAAAEYEARLAELQVEFVERSKVLQLVASEQYSTELKAALRAYFQALDALDAALPGHFDLERVEKQLDAKQRAGKMSEAQREQREERLRFTRSLFDDMRAGRYSPLHTAVDRTFRFDIFALRPIERAGRRLIELSFVHWGAFGEVGYGRVEGRFQSPVPAKGERVAIPKIVAPQQAPTLEIAPQKWIDEFIPGVQIGTYELPAMPPSAESIQLSFDFTMTTHAGPPVPVAIAFEPIPIPDAWRVLGDEPWETRQRVVTEEELRAEGASD